MDARFSGSTRQRKSRPRSTSPPGAKRRADKRCPRRRAELRSSDHATFTSAPKALSRADSTRVSALDDKWLASRGSCDDPDLARTGLEHGRPDLTLRLPDQLGDDLDLVVGVVSQALRCKDRIIEGRRFIARSYFAQVVFLLRRIHLRLFRLCRAHSVTDGLRSQGTVYENPPVGRVDRVRCRIGINRSTTSILPEARVALGGFALKLSRFDDDGVYEASGGDQDHDRSPKWVSDLAEIGMLTGTHVRWNVPCCR
jgi:hypothetical protein